MRKSTVLWKKGYSNLGKLFRGFTRQARRPAYPKSRKPQIEEFESRLLLNIAPSISLTGANSVNEGEAYSLVIAVGNTEGNSVSELTIDWGEEGAVILSAPSGSTYPMDWGQGVTQTSEYSWTAEYTYTDGEAHYPLFVSVFVNGGESTTYLNIIPGDITLDGIVNAQDFAILQENWLTSGATWAQGDFDGDGDVDGSDFATFSSHNSESVDAGNGGLTVNNVAPTDITLSNSIVAENEKGVEVGVLSATDPGLNDTHTFEIIGADTSPFEIIDGSKLKLKANESLDYELASSVAVSITATDSGGLTYTKDLTIQVTDVAPNITVTDFTANGQNLLVSYTISEPLPQYFPGTTQASRFHIGVHSWKTGHLLTEYEVSDPQKLQGGSHTVEIAADFALSDACFMTVEVDERQEWG